MIDRENSTKGEIEKLNQEIQIKKKFQSLEIKKPLFKVAPTVSVYTRTNSGKK